MDYYAIINGQKKGPYDTISIIKLIRSGSISGETLISNVYDGEYVPALQNALISEVFNNQQMTNPNLGYDKHNHVTLGKSLKDGVDLWSRYALSFTIISGGILALTFTLSKSLGKIPAIADYPFVSAYVVSFITSFLYLNFFSYILFAKRSQALETKRYIEKMTSALSANLLFSAILALFTMANALNPVIGIGAMVGFLVFATLGAFVPFIVFDKKVGFGSAFSQSAKKIRKGGSETIGVVLAIVALNIVVAILPAIFVPNLFIFGLFISIPITVSSLAYIYDEIFG